jgi:serine/threonine protein phosphatase PrpC
MKTDRQQDTYSWVGSQKTYVDEADFTHINNVLVAKYGGNSKAGAHKNEDACLVWTNTEQDWEFLMILDAHHTAESAELVICMIEEHEKEITTVLALPGKECFTKLDSLILDLFQAPAFLEACRNIQGETACLITVRKDKYIWWFSIGDCMLHLFHPDLLAFQQYGLTERNFYEWVGQVNTFELDVPCYSTGRRELRQGTTHLLMTTDGLTECPNLPFEHPLAIHNAFEDVTNEEGVKKLIEVIRENGVRDSTTIISYKVTIEEKATMPSDL